MKAQVPAEGVFKRNDWGDAKLYQVVCDCGNDEHDHQVCVEAEDSFVTVTIYSTIKSNYWSKTRFKQMWDLLTKGYVKYESSLIMKEQEALNYAELLKTAVNDSKEFRKQRNKNNGSDPQS